MITLAHPGKSCTINHTWVEHDHCQSNYCAVCDGGLALCKTCGCLEGSLPTDCPGVECYGQYGDAIYAGEIDFVKGEWINECSINSPAFYR